MPDRKNHPPKDILDWMGISQAPNWQIARPLGALFACLLFILFCGAMLVAFAILYRTFFGGAPSLGSGAMITALLGAPFLIWSTVIKHKTLGFQKEGHITDRISKAVEQLGEEKVVKVLVGGQTREETKPNIEVRIGGLLSLERIAQDSVIYDKGRDHVRVMEIICAYVRENAPASGAVDFPLPEWKPLAEGVSEKEYKAQIAQRRERFGPTWLGSKAWMWANGLAPPRADIQAALNVLKRRSPDQRRVEANWGHSGNQVVENIFDARPCPNLTEFVVEEAIHPLALSKFGEALEQWRQATASYCGFRLDLRNCNLQCADLSRAEFSGAMLQGAQMAGVNFRLARLEGADFSVSRAEGAYFHEARIQGATFYAAQLEGGNFSNANMTATNLELARLEGAAMFEARMCGADLSSAGIEAADLRRSIMFEANLHLARLEGADLRAAQIVRSNLTDMNVTGANFGAARLFMADIQATLMDNNTGFESTTFRKSHLREQDLTSVDISTEQFASGFADASVTLPGGKGPDSEEWPEHWPKWVLPHSGNHSFETEYARWLSDPDNYIPPPLPNP